MCGAVEETGAIIKIVQEIVRMCAFAGGLFLVVGLVAAMLEAQLGSISGTPFALARVTERVILITFCLAVVVSAGEAGAQVSAILSKYCTGEHPFEIWRLLAQMVVNILMLTGGAAMVLFVVGSSVGAQLATLAGHPNARATAIAKVGMALVTGVLTLMGVQIANVIITAAFS